MPDYTYTLYDTAVLSNAVTDQVLFQVSQGADATHTESFTNSRGAGQLPTGESFEVKKISATVDGNWVVADQINWILNSFCEIRVSDLTVFKCPLAYLVDGASFGGLYTQASAAEESAIGYQGDGYELEIPIEIQGGVQFRVRIYGGTALSTTGRNVKITLHGTLSLP